MLSRQCHRTNVYRPVTKCGMRAKDMVTLITIRVAIRAKPVSSSSSNNSNYKLCIYIAPHQRCSLCLNLNLQREGAGNGAIIVRFNSDRVRESVHRGQVNLKEFNQVHRDHPVFINDDLTVRRSKLAFH